MSSKSRYESLDAIRGIAAAVVLLHHCLLVLPVWAAVVDSGRRESFLTTLFGFPPLSLIWAGDAAVKVFFVLSGFVLSLMFFDRTPVHYAAFAVKRICRIYLPYLAVVFAGMLLMTALSTYPWPDLSFWVAGSWNGPVTWPLIVDHVLMLGQIKYNIVDNPIWSLVIEMRYSLAFPAIIWLISRTRSQVAFSASLLFECGVDVDDQSVRQILDIRLASVCVSVCVRRLAREESGGYRGMVSRVAGWLSSFNGLHKLAITQYFLPDSCQASCIACYCYTHSPLGRCPASPGRNRLLSCAEDADSQASALVRPDIL